ncbi:hypothetical protein V8E54_001036 [Elaphomyces granulatus]
MNRILNNRPMASHSPKHQESQSGAVTSHEGLQAVSPSIQNTVEINASPQGRSLNSPNSDIPETSVVEEPSQSKPIFSFERAPAVIKFDQMATIALPSPTRTKGAASFGPNGERQATATSNKSLKPQLDEDPGLHEPLVHESKGMDEIERRPVQSENPPQTRAIRPNPEALAKVRDGPGTDPASDISRMLARRLIIDHSQNGPESRQGQHDKFKFHEGMTEDEKDKAQWEFYRQDIQAYPKIEDGQVVLQNDPTSGHLYTPPAVSSDGSILIGLPQPPELPEGVEPDEWNSPFPANWQYRPLVCTNYEAFRNWFYDWLDSTTRICYYVDIYHESFFDGTAHADGELSLFIPNISHEETLPDMNDAKTRLHRHETSDGYRYNFTHRLQKEEELLEGGKVRARSIYFKAWQYEIEPNRNVLKENICLRPVDITDIPQLLRLHNWYVAHATQCRDIEPLNDVDLRGRIDSCRRARLPFIVAVERRVRTCGRERIMGYALATVFMGPQTIGRFTANLEVYVDNAKTRLGIGQCLVDKLLEVCDSTYITKQCYLFDCSPEDRSLYSSDSSRKLELIFSFGYSPDDPTEYRWVKEWLKLNYGFQEHVLLKGAGVKFGKSLNISYLLRKIANA